MTLKDLMKKLSTKSPFWTVWAFAWRAWVLSLAIYAVAFIVMLGFIA